MTCYFQKLPTEIITYILEQAGATDELANLLSVCSHCFQVFSISPKQILQVPSTASRDFCAAVYAGTRLCGDESLESVSRKKTDIEAFVNRYFDDTATFDLPTARLDILYCVRLQKRALHFVEYMIKDAAKQAVLLTTMLPEEAKVRLGGDEYDAFKDHSFEVSKEDKETLYQSVLRFEIYCQAFRTPAQPVRRIPFGRREQRSMFIERCSPVDVERITCVYICLAYIIGDTLDEMERRFESAIQAVSLGISDGARRSPLREQESLQPQDIVEFSSLDRGLLAIYSSFFRHESIDYIGALVSHGLGYMFEFTQADHDQRSKQIRGTIPTFADFWPLALGRWSGSPAPAHVAWHLNMRQWLPEDVVTTERCFNLEFYNERLLKKSLLIHHHEGVFALRAIGYPFWGLKALDGLPPLKRCSSDLFKERRDRSHKRSAEERLEGTSVLYKDFLRIEEEFGLTLPLHG